MKRKMAHILLMFTAFLMPINALAYSDYIIPGGETIGIEIKSPGIMVVGFYKIDGKFNKGTPALKIGDIIIEVDGKSVETVEQLTLALERETSLPKKITVLRNNKKKEITLEMIKDGDAYKTGLYVKSEITGIGTLTYIDPETGIYGALGHNVIETNSQETVKVRAGSIFRSSITSIDRSVSGTPGGKNAKFYSGNKYGTIDKNISSGIYGAYTKEIPTKKALKVADVSEIGEGNAKIITVLNGESLGEYDIKITKVDKDSSTKNIYFDVVDKELLEKTGGIVQGMSGSPIIQGNKIIGAVTHVVISNPSSGFGISIKTMLEEGER